MQRRNFLGGLAGILAAGSAPAIIHDAMKIYVPKQDVVVPNLGRGLTTSIIHLDESPLQFGLGNVDNDHFQDEFGEAFFPTVIITPEAEKNIVAFMRRHHAQVQRQTNNGLRRLA